MMTLEHAKEQFKVGQIVRYVPGHAHGNLEHEDCEDGIVTSLGKNTVFVRFWDELKRFGWSGTCPQGCYKSDLHILSEGVPLYDNS